MPLHLMLSMSALASSTFALEWLSSASKNLNLPPKKKRLLSQLPEAVKELAQKKHNQLLVATEVYESYAVATSRCILPVIWRAGNACLRDGGVYMKSAPKAYALLVPSLINRYYILDLSEKRSLIQYMAAEGIYPLILDWDEPGETEQDFTMADYVTEVLLPAIECASSRTASPIHLLGYCLGGVLSLAAAQLAPDKIASLSLLATPWNFKSEDTASLELSTQQLDIITQMMSNSPHLHPMALQWLFMLRQPSAYEQKFLKLHEMKRQSDIEEFVLIERWVNDNVPMSSPAAVDCLIRWAQQNELFKGKWKVAGKIIDPAKIKAPSFLSIPSQDHIVPTDCAVALANKLKSAQTIHPNTGHVGMVVGRKARRECWEPYVKFITSLKG